MYVGKLVRLISSKKGAIVTLAIWLIAVVGMMVFAPSASDYEGSSEEASISGDKPSEIANDLKEEKFPSKDGLTGLLVFYKEDGDFSDEERNEIEELTKWLDSDDKPEEIASTLPFHEFPKEVQDQMFSEDGTTLLINMAMEKDVSSSDTGEVLDKISDKVDSPQLSDVDFEVTGPLEYLLTPYNYLKMVISY